MKFGWRSWARATCVAAAIAGLSGCESVAWENFPWPGRDAGAEKAAPPPITVEPPLAAAAPAPVKPPGLPDHPAPAKPKVIQSPPPKPDAAEPEGGEVALLETPVVPEVRPMPPARLVGLSEEGTESILGKAVSVSEQPPAQVWLYTNDQCQLSLFFYMDVNKREFRVLTYEIFPKYVDEARCVGTLHESHARNIH